MESKKIVVIGGVAGGMSFATRYRRLNQNDSIIVLDKGQYVSFANCGLPYHISGEIENRDNLLVAKKEMLEDRFQIDVRVNSEVIALNHKSKQVSVKSPDGIYEIDYDKLVISVGAKAIELTIPGSETNSDIYTLRNLTDMDRILSSLNHNDKRSAIVIGAGFIGLEMAEALKNRGLNVSVVEKAPHVLPPLDVEMAAMAQRELIKNDIKTYTNNSISKISGNVSVLEDGTEIDGDIIIMAVGVAPATEFLKNTDIILNRQGGIVVDEHYKTSVDDVYAVGDAIVTFNSITNQDAMIALASPANRQGRHLADILSGSKRVNTGSLATAIVRIFNMSFASTGLNERMVDIDSVYIMHLKANSHAGYFPNATPITLKVIIDRTTHKILGAQAFGEKGVDKRIDIIATAIRAGLTVDALQDIEFTYAPPFGSAKDIINMAGYVGENLISGLTKMVQWHQVDRYQNDDSKLILDVRSQEEYAAGRIKGAINMPLDRLRCTMSTLPLEKEILVYCASGIRSYNAEMILRNAGFNVTNLDGAYGLYELAMGGSL